MLNTALLEKQTELLERTAGIDPGFDLAGYRKYLRDRMRDAAALRRYTPARTIAGSVSGAYSFPSPRENRLQFATSRASCFAGCARKVMSQPSRTTSK